MGEHTSDLTGLLGALERGEAGAESRLFEAVYDELRRMAAGMMAREGPGRTLRATDLVHEAYLRLVPEGGSAAWESRAHFFGAAAEAMRRILVDRARARARLKRGGNWSRVDLEAVDTGEDSDPGPVLALDGALARLEAFDERAAEIVKLRCFVGLTIAEVAQALSLSTRTVNRDWLVAKAWLKGELAPGSGEPAERRGPEPEDA